MRKTILSWKSFYILLLFSFMCFCFYGCTKKGPVGLIGQEGPAGDPGPQGPRGPQGSPGGDGDGAVFTSEWLSLSFDQEGNWWIASIPDDKITRSVIDGTGIIVKMKDEQGTIFELNYFTDDVKMNVDLEVGKINIESTQDPSSNLFRYLIIPTSN